MHGGAEMKKLLVAFFIILFAHVAYADNYVVFKSEVVEKAINQLVPSENRQAAADEYQKNMDQTNGKISVIGLYKVCIASGFNIQGNDGYNLCRNFLNFMISETENMGVGIASQKNCANQFNGVWTISSDGATYQCVGRDGYELVYNRACRGADGECIKQFSKLQTQGSNGREFIDAYGKLHGLNLTCHINADINTFGQDYIMCSAGGKAYEFEFDDLNQTPGSRSSSSENTAICELYGGKIVDTGDKSIEDTWQSCDISADLCNGSVDVLAMRTGHTTQYQGYCRLSREIKRISVAFLNQISGIDSYVFYNAGAQMRMDTAKPMLEEYLHTSFPNETYIVCDSNPKKLNDGLGMDIDYVISCAVGRQQVDFVFDDISETSNMAADAGIDAMQCIITGGDYDGKFCRWLNEDECNELNNEQQDVARWDEKAGACVMLDSTKYEAFKNGVMAIGGTVFGIAVTVATGGGVLVALAIVATDAVFEGVFAILQRLQETNPQHRAVQFIKETKDCHDSACASKAITNHFVRLNEIMDGLSTDMQNVIMDQFEYLSGLLTEEEFNNAMNASGLKLEDKVYNASGWMLALAALFVNPDQAIVKGMARAPKLAGRLGRWVNTVQNISHYGDNIARRLQNLLGKTPEFSSGSVNTLGHDFYRIFIDNDAEVPGILQKLQSNGFHVSANSTRDGEKFLAVSEEKIFEKWDNASTNWLESFRSGSVVDFGADIVQKTNRAATLRGGNTRPYNYYFVNIDGMVRSDVQKLMDNLKNSGYDDVFLTLDNGKYVINVSNPTIRGGKAIDNSRVQQFGIEYISRTKGTNIADVPVASGSNANKIQRILSAGDRTAQYLKLGELGFVAENADEIVYEIIPQITDFIKQNNFLLQQVRNWDSIDLQMKKSITDYLNYYIGGLRREHKGNTIINFGDAGKDGKAFASFRREFPDSPKEYTYSLDGKEHKLSDASFSTVLESIIHENVHSWQYNGTSSIPLELVELRGQLKTQELYDTYYRQDLLEKETFYIAPKATRSIIQNLGL